MVKKFLELGLGLGGGAFIGVVLYHIFLVYIYKKHFS